MMTTADAQRVILDGRFALPAVPLEGGGHARLYKAYDLELEQPAAVKLFEPYRPVDEQTLRLAWSNELDAYTRLGSHRNLLGLLSYGTSAEETQWIAFEWCGEDLEKFVLKSAVSWELLRPVFYEILSGLAVLHSQNFIHRDLKPKNILVADGAVKIADFGTIRLREVTSLGLTMNQLGTKPYAPPESGTLNPVPAYDIYSFAVLVLACLTKNFEMDESETERVLGSVAVPEDVRSVLAKCLAADPDGRPGSAAVLLAELQQIEKQSRPLAGITEVGLEITPGALGSFCESVAAEQADLSDVIGELSPRVRVMQDTKEDLSADVLLLGRTIVAVAAVHSTRPGFLVIKHVWKPKASHLERLRKQSLTLVIQWSSHLMRPQEASQFIAGLLRSVREKRAEIRDDRAARSEVHDRWERVLSAKFTLARDRGSDIAYTSFRTDGARIFLSIGTDEVMPNLGELRVIRTTSNRLVRAEVESVEDGEMGLYVSEGNVADIPRRGILSVDSDRTRSKLLREQAALRRVFEGGAVRKDLKDILNNPKVNPEPGVANIDSFFQPDLDDAKQAALRAVMGLL
jgi:Protein kinase domain